jgi:hypothetical protein
MGIEENKPERMQIEKNKKIKKSKLKLKARKDFKNKNGKKRRIK